MLYRACVIVGLAMLLASAGTRAKCAPAADEKEAAAARDNAAAEKPADDEPAAKPAEAPPKKPAAEAAKDDLGEGRLIRVRLPLTGDADSAIKATIKSVVDQLSRLPRREGRRPTLVLELFPQGGPASFGNGTDFTRALSLANFLTQPEMAAVKTVAYIPRTIKGHGVLIALACEEIVMDPDAEIGDASIDEDSSRAVDPSIVSAYQQIAATRRTVPQAIAIGMIDRRPEVLKVETDQSIEFIRSDELDALKKNHTIVNQDSIKSAGSPGIFTGRDGREYGFVKSFASNPDQLAQGLAVPAATLQEDQSKLGGRRPVRLYIEGPITRHKVNQLKTILGAELKRKVNWIGITIDSAGGDLEDCLELADMIARLDTEAAEVQTVAYVPLDASGGAALVALSCKQLVMQPEAHIGGRGTVPIDRPTLDAARESIRASLAKHVSHSWSLLDAMIDPDIELYTYKNAKTGEVRYFSDEEAKSQADADDWQRGARIKAVGDALQLSANRAKELGIANHVVDNFDDYMQIYGFNGDVRVAEPNWALELVEALSSPALAVLLLVVGFVGVYIELHSPGTGIGGFVAAVAFLLFFWSNFLNGTAEWLEVLLFLGGIFFLLLEVLVLPGFGIFGLGGGAMMLAALVLATQTFVLPRTESQMVELRHSLTIVAASTLIVIVSSMALRRYLPSAPIFRKLLLNPTPEEELVDLDYRESLADFSHLVGEQGIATTNLMPSGKGEFNGQLVDVITEGLPIDRGTALVVMKARGNRVVVRAVDA